MKKLCVDACTYIQKNILHIKHMCMHKVYVYTYTAYTLMIMEMYLTSLDTIMSNLNLINKHNILQGIVTMSAPII